ncbi:unnamed protein product [Urochloa humidicola]
MAHRSFSLSVTSSPSPPHLGAPASALHRFSKPARPTVTNDGAACAIRCSGSHPPHQSPALDPVTSTCLRLKQGEQMT